MEDTWVPFLPTSDVLTSRPGNLGPAEDGLLSSLAFVSIKTDSQTRPRAEDVQLTVTRHGRSPQERSLC